MLLFDLSDRVKLCLLGDDRIRFLNGQVTNDIRRVSANVSMPACVLNAKGKMDALIFVSATDDGLLIDADLELKAILGPRLERYIIADDVVVDDWSEEFALFHLTGKNEPESPYEWHWRRSRRFGVEGSDLLIKAAESDRVRQQLMKESSFCDSDGLEEFRIEQGVPRWGRELTNEIIPVEAGLEKDAIDYDKGCYIGQEVISRMKMSGQTNKRLCGLISLDDKPLIAGMRLTTKKEESKDAGWITSAIYSSRLKKEIALGYVRRGYYFQQNPGSQSHDAIELFAQAGDNSSTDEKTRVRVVSLPFVNDRD